MVFAIIYYTLVLLFACLTYASVEGKIPVVPRLQHFVVFGLSLISEWPLPVIVLKIILINIASMLGVFRGIIPQLFYIVDLLNMIGLVVIFIDADEARRAIEQAIQSYSDQRELPTFSSETFWQRMVIPHFVPQNVFQYADICYVNHSEATEAKKDGFEQVNYLTLDIYARKDISRSTPKPVFMYIHGGEWIRGDKASPYPLIRHLAEVGWVVVSINYRLASTAFYPAQLIDAKRALRWVKQNIEHFGGDPKFIAVAGDDAGGQIAAVLALTPNKPEYQPGFENVDTSVKACVLINAITDLVDDEQNLWGSDYFSKKIAGRQTKDITFLKEHSPLHLIKDDSVPFLVFHGDRDTSVPFRSSSIFVEEFKKKCKAEIQFISIPGGHHVYNLFSSPRSHYQAIGVEQWLNHIHSEEGNGDYAWVSKENDFSD
ncbi:Alpha/Beta hydrolase protein [Glomus cerebriforme]|uniref:Alpha/Beta hydrolase protein n=1 Tax=Glomus cerebriforme TaxID=658196 RepID=A0A397SRW6_9GLOM|nr:Alpha/Beta hydrolase protein [Glomus cerebriforme]